MKKLLLITTLGCALGAQAATKYDLEKAIRSLDVEKVQEIISAEKFTQREYDRYSALADQVMNLREKLFLNLYTTDDVSTPYEGPSVKQLFFESLGIGVLAQLFKRQKSGLKWLELGSFILISLQAIVKDFPEQTSRELSHKLSQPRMLLDNHLLKETVKNGITGAAALILCSKLVYDCFQVKAKWDKRKQDLFKKYDDAVTIKQLMYTAEVAA